MRVRDTGPGIDPESLEHVFDRFYRSPGSPGTGLGLPIARNLVRAHGGQITINSSPGGGTEVRFTLPTRPRSLSRVARVPAGRSADCAGRQTPLRLAPPRATCRGRPTGSGQAVRRLTLDQEIEGSNPSSPAMTDTMRGRDAPSLRTPLPPATLPLHGGAPGQAAAVHCAPRGQPCPRARAAE